MVEQAVDIAIKVMLIFGLGALIWVIHTLMAFAIGWCNQRVACTYWSREALEMDILRQLCDDAIHAVDKHATAVSKLNGPDMESAAKKMRAIQIVHRLGTEMGLPPGKIALADDMIESVLGAHMPDGGGHHDHNHGHDDSEPDMS